MARPFTPDEINYAFALWAQGYPAREIAKRMGRDRRVIETALQRGRDWRPAYRTTGWTEAKGRKRPDAK